MPLGISPVNALRQAIVTLVVKNAISVVKSVTLPATALRAVASVMDTAAMADASRPVIPAAASVIWLVIAPRVKNATTVERLGMSPATVLRRRRVSGFATSASSQATFRLPVPIRVAVGS